MMTVNRRKFVLGTFALVSTPKNIFGAEYSVDDSNRTVKYFQLERIIDEATFQPSCALYMKEGDRTWNTGIKFSRELVHDLSHHLHDKKLVELNLLDILVDQLSELDLTNYDKSNLLQAIQDIT